MPRFTGITVNCVVTTTTLRLIAVGAAVRA